MLDFFDRLFSRSDPQRNGGYRRRNPDFLTWLYPGMHVKRWLLLLMFGVALFGLGVAYFLRDIYVFYTFPEPVYYITLQFLPRTIRGVLFIIVAASAIGFGVAGLNRSLLSAMRNGNGNNQSGRPLVSLVYKHRYGNRGPKTVAIGGGTGLSVLLRGMKEHTDNLTAIVTVADDGGSSGILRRELGVLPPGDFRNCIAALADAEPLVTRLMQYRFSEGSGLEGHSFGNLFIVAMTGVVGNFEEALRETGRVLAVRGQILPATLDNVTLTAEMADAQTVRGEHLIGETHRPISRVFLDPPNATPYPDAIRAILDAELVVLGPGSVFTSVLPNLLVNGIPQAIRDSKATKVYVCNVATQPGETDGFDAEQHAETLVRHVGPGIFDYFLVHDVEKHPVPSDGLARPVLVSKRGLPGVSVILENMVSNDSPLRHDSQKLSIALMQLLQKGPALSSDPEPELVSIRGR